jgi:hypothetical protein
VTQMVSTKALNLGTAKGSVGHVPLYRWGRPLSQTNRLRPHKKHEMKLFTLASYTSGAPCYCWKVVNWNKSNGSLTEVNQKWNPIHLATPRPTVVSARKKLFAFQHLFLVPRVVRFLRLPACIN